MSLRSFVLRQLGQAADSLAAADRALVFIAELEQAAPEVLSPVGRVPILLNRGAALADLGRTAESLAPLAQALDILRAGGTAAYREVEIELLVLRGTSLTLLGQLDEAEAAEMEAIALARTEQGRSGRHLLAASLNSHATTLMRMRRFAQRRRWGIPLSTQAEVLLALGRRQDAARAARRAEPIMREYAEEVPLLVAGSLANVCLLIGEAEDDPVYAREALERFTALKDQFPGRYDFWWRRAADLDTRLREGG
jgi:tetratricopeptide (TPR) repeat protein